MTLAELLTDLTTRIGIVKGQEVNNTQLTFWLNEALRIFCLEDDFRWLEKRALASTVANQQEYALPSDFSKMFELRVDATTTDSGVYGYVPYEQRFGIQTGEKAYTILGNTLFLYPTPTQSTSSNIEITYYKNPSNMIDQSDSPSDTDIASMPEAFHPALVVYAFALYNGYDEEATDSQYWLGNSLSPTPGTYNWYVKLAKKMNAQRKRGERIKMLSKQQAIGYTKPSDIGKVSEVLKI